MRESHAGVLVGRIANRPRARDVAAGRCQVDVGTCARASGIFDRCRIDQIAIRCDVNGGRSSSTGDGACRCIETCIGGSSDLAQYIDVAGGVECAAKIDGISVVRCACAFGDSTCGCINYAKGVVDGDVGACDGRTHGNLAVFGLHIDIGRAAIDGA